MLRHRSFSAFLLLNGQLATDSLDSSPNSESNSNTKRAIIRTPTLVNADTAFTVIYKDNRQSSAELDEAQVATSTVRVNGHFRGVGAASNGQSTDEGGMREEPSVSGLIGPTDQNPTTIALSIKLLNKPGGGDHVVFEFVLLPPLDPIETVPESCNPRDVSPAITPLQINHYQPRNQSNFENPPPQLHITPTQWEELSNQLKTTRESAEYFEAATAKFWDLLPPSEKITYLEERLKLNEISAAMRVSIAVSRNDAVKEVEKAKLDAIQLEIDAVKKFYDSG